MNNQEHSGNKISFRWLHPVPAAKKTRQIRARRNERLLMQNMKQTMLASQNVTPPSPDPLGA